MQRGEMKSNEASSNDFVDTDDFWLKASKPSLDAIWDNPEDNIYAEIPDRIANKLTYVRQRFVKTKKEIP